MDREEQLDYQKNRVEIEMDDDSDQEELEEINE